MMVVIRKARSLLFRASERSSSLFRIAFARLMNSNLDISWSSTVGSGVKFRVSDGGAVVIKSGTSIGDNALIVTRGGQCLIGEDCFIGHGCTIVATESIVIGRGCLIGEYVSIRDQDHNIDSDSEITRSGLVSAPIEVGQGVWIGAHSTVTRGCRIDNGAVVGANSVARGQIHSRSVNVGAPARQIRLRKTDTNK